MGDIRGELPHRIGLLAEQTSGLPAQRDPGQQLSTEDRLLGVLTELHRLVTAGNLPADAGTGVLLDTTVGDVRCVLVQLRPSIEVGLSPREQQIARMVAGGRTNQAIAAALEISVWTVSTHLRRIFAKLAVSSRAEMVAHLRQQTDFAAVLDPGERRPRRD
jgi:DNA-binding CsgD family transcriptional regulator